jgi:hypothetical protein
MTRRQFSPANPTERRWNRTIQPGGCPGLPVFKLAALSSDSCALEGVRFGWLVLGQVRSAELVTQFGTLQVACRWP